MRPTEVRKKEGKFCDPPDGSKQERVLFYFFFFFRRQPFWLRCQPKGPSFLNALLVCPSVSLCLLPGGGNGSRLRCARWKQRRTKATEHSSSWFRLSLREQTYFFLGFGARSATFRQEIDHSLKVFEKISYPLILLVFTHVSNNRGPNLKKIYMRKP